MSVIADDLEDGISSHNLEADVSLQTVQLMSRVRSRLPVKGLTRRVYGILCHCNSSRIDCLFIDGQQFGYLDIVEIAVIRRLISYKVLHDVTYIYEIDILESEVVCRNSVPRARTRF